MFATSDSSGTPNELTHWVLVLRMLKFKTAPPPHVGPAVQRPGSRQEDREVRESGGIDGENHPPPSPGSGGARRTGVTKIHRSA